MTPTDPCLMDCWASCWCWPAAPRSPVVPASGGGAATGQVTGSVTYRERIALPPTAVVQVRLVDVSRADAPAVLIAEQVIRHRRTTGSFRVRARVRRVAHPAGPHLRGAGANRGRRQAAVHQRHDAPGHYARRTLPGGHRGATRLRSAHAAAAAGVSRSAPTPHARCRHPIPARNARPRRLPVAAGSSGSGVATSAWRTAESPCPACRWP